MFLYAACLGVPVVLWLRLPPALDPPTSEDDPELEDYLQALKKRLAKNPRLTGQPLDTREDVEAALESLDEEVDREIRDIGHQVFMTTAISQNGSLDALRDHRQPPERGFPRFDDKASRPAKGQGGSARRMGSGGVAAERAASASQRVPDTW